jgi:protoporphyrinogen oxidase
MKTKYLILGAGPAGLSFANVLRQRGEENFTVIEKEAQAGGLCRSQNVDGSPLDIGGGHFLDVRRPEVCLFLFGFMPKEEWREYDRDSRIRFTPGFVPDADKREYEIHHPFEANLWELPENIQKPFLESIAAAGCNAGQEMPEKFVDWISWKLGDLIAKEYMLPYNMKMFGDNLNALGTYWLEKLPNVSYEDTLKSCREKKAAGSQPGHAQFFYPKEYGYGELWLRMGEALGDRLITGAGVTELSPADKRVTLSDGTVIEAEIIVTTVPWTSMRLTGVPQEITDAVSKLIHTSIEVTYHPEDMNTDAQWIYYPSDNMDHHRILLRGNFYEGAKGYWTETRTERYHAQDGDINFHMEYAYPVNTIDKPEAIDSILRYMKGCGVYGLGRWGEHNHYNSDATVELAMKLAKEL